jgi:hypothetical protein
VRKFEIDLFWKRSLFFWTFIGAALVAYAALMKEREDELSFAVEWRLRKTTADRLGTDRLRGAHCAN